MTQQPPEQAPSPETHENDQGRITRVKDDVTYDWRSLEQVRRDLRKAVTYERF